MTSSAVAQRSETSLVLIAYFSFIVMGLPGAILGVLWSPYIQETFALSIDAIGVYLIAFTIGYFAMSSLSGRLVARYSVGNLLIASALMSAVALLAIGFAPVWAVILGAGLVWGLSSGMQDAGLNIVFAARFNNRLMNWLHASFGIGATIAPLIGTAFIGAGLGWRSSYIVLFVLYLAVAAAFFFTRERWDLPRANVSVQQSPSISLRRTLGLPVVWVGIGLFFGVAALEAATGQWIFPLFNQMRGVDEVTAGTWVSLYWASFTVGRIVFGIFNVQAVGALLRYAALGVIAGALLLWWNPIAASGLIAILLIGFSVAPMFAAMVTNTHTMLGAQHAPNAIGVQMAASSVGLGIMPGLAGILADAISLEAIPPFILAIGIGYLLLVLLIEPARKRSMV